MPAKPPPSVLRSMALSENPAAESSGSWRRDLLLLALLFGTLYFFRLGSYPLSNPDEGRNAEVPREMLATGDWVTPRLNGVNYFEKPPLVYWVTGAIERTFGLNEWSVRAVPALFAVAGILITYAAARGLRDRITGLLAALVLGTSLLWFVIGHIPILDTAMSVFMSGTLFCFLLGVREESGVRRRWLFMGLYACAALATLTKGLMGFMVTGAVMFLWLLVFNQWKRLRPLYLPTGVLLFLAIAAPWHVLAALRNDTWVHRYIVFEHFLRFLTPVASRPGPWHLFIWVVIGGLIPWTGFLWSTARDLAREGWRRRGEHAETWFLITWVVFIVFFFSTSKSKLAPYVLPVFPALAVLVATEFARAWEENSSAPLRAGFRLLSFCCGLLAAAVVMVVIVRPELARIPPPQAFALRPAAIALATILLVGGIGVPWIARVKGVHAAVAAIGAMMVLFYGALEFAAPIINKPGTKDLALWVKAHAGPDDRVFHCYDFYQDFTFYAERPVGVVGNYAELEIEEDVAAQASGRFINDAQLLAQWGAPGRIFLVIQERKIDELKRDFARAATDWDAKLAKARETGTKPDGTPPEQPVFTNPSFQYHLIARTPAFLLVSNQP
jgi:4-amino-4-deoxy-L-arabinose transferase-like glycosyltransferase